MLSLAVASSRHMDPLPVTVTREADTSLSLGLCLCFVVGTAGQEGQEGRTEQRQQAEAQGRASWLSMVLLKVVVNCKVQLPGP